MRLLLAEDERELRRALTVILEKSGYVVDAAEDGEMAQYLLSCNEYDLAILDIMMPKVDGLTVLRGIRADGSGLPVLLLTAKSEIDDRVEGLDAGANDYLTKPFAAKELLARIRALTRTSPGVAAQGLSFGDLRLDADGSRLVCGEESVELSPREYAMMEVLVRAGDHRVSTEEFLRRVWGGDADVEANVVWVNLSNLRKKLARVGSTTSIRAQRNVGYYLEG